MTATMTTPKLTATEALIAADDRLADAVWEIEAAVKALNLKLAAAVNAYNLAAEAARAEAYELSEAAKDAEGDDTELSDAYEAIVNHVEDADAVEVEFRFTMPAPNDCLAA